MYKMKKEMGGGVTTILWLSSRHALYIQIRNIPTRSFSILYVGAFPDNKASIVFAQKKHTSLVQSRVLADRVQRLDTTPDARFIYIYIACLFCFKKIASRDIYLRYKYLHCLTPKRLSRSPFESRSSNSIPEEELEEHNPEKAKIPVSLVRYHTHHKFSN